MALLYPAARYFSRDAAGLPVHSHSTPLHQAVLLDDPAMLELLLARAARTDVRDGLWGGTPLDWAIHERRPRAVIERLSAA